MKVRVLMLVLCSTTVLAQDPARELLLHGDDFDPLATLSEAELTPPVAAPRPAVVQVGEVVAALPGVREQEHRRDVLLSAGWVTVTETTVLSGPSTDVVSVRFALPPHAQISAIHDGDFDGERMRLRPGVVTASLVYGFPPAYYASGLVVGTFPARGNDLRAAQTRLQIAVGSDGISDVTINGQGILTAQSWPWDATEIQAKVRVNRTLVDEVPVRGCCQRTIFTAGPRVAPSRHVLFLVDVSNSMRSRSGLASQSIHDIVSGLPETSRFRLAVFGVDTQWLLQRASSANEFLAVLAGEIRWGISSRTHLPDLDNLLHGIDDLTDVIVVTDGLAEDPHAFEVASRRVNLPVHWVTVGERTERATHVSDGAHLSGTMVQRIWGNRVADLADGSRLLSGTQIVLERPIPMPAGVWRVRHPSVERGSSTTPSTRPTSATSLSADSVLESLRRNLVPAARRCFRRDRSGRADYRVRAEYELLLADEEVARVAVRGELSTGLRSCLEHATAALSVPAFSGALLIRYPLSTRAVEEPRVETRLTTAAEFEEVFSRLDLHQ